MDSLLIYKGNGRGAEGPGAYGKSIKGRWTGVGNRNVGSQLQARHCVHSLDTDQDPQETIWQSHRDRMLRDKGHEPVGLYTKAPVTDQVRFTHVNGTKSTKLLVFLPFWKTHFSAVLFGPLKSEILGIDSKNCNPKPSCALEAAI